jgi:predicted NUDIX family phosphoesterase
MGLGDDILVVKREVLFENQFFQGFVPKDNMNFIPTILSNYEYKIRTRELEQDNSYQQIISYVWIINPKTKQVFSYKRASNKKYSEERLKSRWSCGVGGHIEKADGVVGEEGDPIESVLMREMQEEVKMKDYPIPKIVGFINDDSDNVGKVHFGVVAIVETLDFVEKGDDEMEMGKFFSTGHLYTLGEMERIFNDPSNEIETWTRISWPFVKDYLQKL